MPDTVLDGNELRYVTECIQTNWISSIGPYVRRFESEFANAAGCKYGVACANGTVALHLALATLGIGHGDEVILPAFTMIATPNAVSYTGADPVLVDAEPFTWNMDVDLIEQKITSRTKAIIVVHTYGHPVDMDPVNDIARRHNLLVIEDAAEAHGATYHNRPAGSLSDAATFSFYANKIVTTGEGGMITTNNEELALTARRLRDHAFSAERHFWHQYLGFNYRMTNLQAAIGLAQTERLAELIETRRRNAGLYHQALGDIKGLGLPQQPPMPKMFSGCTGSSSRMLSDVHAMFCAKSWQSRESRLAPSSSRSIFNRSISNVSEDRNSPWPKNSAKEVSTSLQAPP